MIRTLLIVCLCLLIPMAPLWAHDEDKEATRPLIQIAILLDTSGSMDGLIEQAKTQLWKIVNEFIAAKKEGVRPEFQVALYEYGKQSIPAQEGYLRMILPLTTDLDKVSEELFALKTNGGDEYCGRVIQAATQGLAWSAVNDDLKVIFIAGNEPFTQGAIDYKKACAEAIAKGIIVNTIFCGPHQEGINTFWKHGSQLADGMYLNIDQNRQVVAIQAPQDDEILRLNSSLNNTYVVLRGKKAEAGKERQEAQDSAAGASSAESLVQRSVSKSSGFYKNDSWDLVDKLKSGEKLEEISEEELPEEMKKMGEEERKAYIEKKDKERSDIQEQIQKLNEERKQYIAEKRKEMSASGADSLDVAMIKALRQQAAKKNYSIE